MRWFLSTLVLGCCVSYATAKPDGAALLKRSMEAWPTMQHQGIQSSYLNTPGLGSSLCKITIVRDKKGRTRISDHSGNITLDDGLRLYEYYSSARTLKVGWPARQSKAEIERLWRIIKRNYQFVVNGTSSIAGRSCYIVTALPLHNTGLKRKYWVDSKKYALLRLDVYNREGIMVLSNKFEAIDFDTPVSPIEFQPNFEVDHRVQTYKPQIYKDINALRKAAGFGLVLPNQVPLGYTFSHAQLQPMGNKRVAALLYTDGISNISIYQLLSPIEKQPPKSKVTANESVWEFFHKRTRIVLVGDVDLEGLRMFAKQMNAQQETQMRASLQKHFKLDPTVISKLRSAGFGFDEIAALAMIRQRSKKSYDEYVRLYRQGYNWRDIASRYKLDRNYILKRIRVIIQK